MEVATRTLKEVYGEEVVGEISIHGEIDEVFSRVCTFVDPFYPRLNEENTIRVAADVPEDGEPVLFGEYGPYCPTTLIKDGWLYPGKEEPEVYVRSKRYRFAGDKELTHFKENIEKYLKVGRP